MNTTLKRSIINALAVAALLSSSALVEAAKAKKPVSPDTEARLETYRDLINKAQNLTLQRDRLQTSQVLIRGIQRESKNSPAYKELVKALDELTSVFYTEKAQTLYALGESVMDSKPKESIEPFQEALRIEDGNLTLLKALSRTYLALGECDKADATERSAETVNPYSAEIKLIRLQILDCQKNFDALALRLEAPETELDGVEKFSRGLQMKAHFRKKDFKKAKSVLTNWEAQMSDYPEVHFWKWRLAEATGTTDRPAAVRYAQLCQTLTPRKRKSFILDVDLCKGKEAVDQFLKESGFQPSAPNGGRND